MATTTDAAAIVTVNGRACPGRLGLIIALLVGQRGWLNVDATDHGGIEVAWADGHITLRVRHSRHGFKEPV